MFTLRNITFKPSIILVSVALVTACQSGGQQTPSTSPRPMAKSNVKYTAQKGLSSRQRFTKALEYLEFGQEGQATAELTAYLVQIPASKRAQELLEQIRMDPARYFPSDSFPIQLTSGESLSTLAKKYLGSALKFYALAKYNNITNPSHVNIGQYINIPLTDRAITVRAEEKTNKASVKKVVPPAPKKIDKPKVKTVAVVQPSAPAVTATMVMSQIATMAHNNDFGGAMEKVTALKKFGALTREGRNIAITALLGHGKQLSSYNKVLAASRFAEAGDMNLMNGDTLTAFNNFRTATNLDPKNDQAMGDMLVLQKDITDKYHREASSAFRRQELDLAITKWNKVLEINPEHASAKLYRAQALELKEKLAIINKKN